MICKHCKTLLVYKPSLDLTICPSCNYVSEAQISSQIEFTSAQSKISGRLIRITDNHVRIGTTLRQVSNTHIATLIGNICGPLGLHEAHADHALRWYKLTLQHNLSRGRSIMCTLSACVYIVCRLESTPHFLIDFSALLHIDVFKIGKIFTRLVGLLNIVLPAVDPALFVARYFRRLRYRDKRIMGLAVRIVQRMKRDWIVVGKRPNNVCGAALLVAGRVYGEDRSMQEVARVVNVCVSSIKKRLGELNMTKSADVSVKEFVEVWLEEDCGYRNCFDFKGFNEGGGELEGEKNNKPENYEENDEDDKPDNYKNDSDKPNDSDYKPDSDNYKPNDSDNYKPNDSDNYKPNESDNYKPNDSDNYKPNDSDNYKPDKTYNLNNINLDDEIPSSEISEMILSEDEFRRREKIWDQMYGEFMREKEQKRKMQKMQKNRKIVENKIRRERSSRINYKSLEKILKD